MATPIYNGSAAPTQDEVAQAAEAGLPVIDGLQSMANARMSGVNWYHLEDGTERVQDDAGNQADWPD